MKLIAQEYDPISGFHEEFWYDPPDQKSKAGRITIKRYQYVDETLDANALMRNNAPSNFYQDDGLYHKARIPFSVLEQWMSEGFNWFSATDKEKRKRLNDPAYKKLLVREGKM